MAKLGARNKLAVFWGWDQGCFMHACVITVARCGMRELKGLSCHQSSGFKHLNNFNDDDHIIATHISWELIDAC